MYVVIGNFVVVGFMEFVIEIWDLDLVDLVEFVVVLGIKVKLKGKKVVCSFIVKLIIGIDEVI